MSTDESAPSQRHPGPSAKLFIPALLVGWGIMAYGASTALGNARDAHPFALAVHVVAFDLAHDLIVAPTAFVVAWLVGKFIPAGFRSPVRAALATSVLTVGFSYPLVRRWGKRATNSSTLPLAYGRNVILLLVIIWVLAIVVGGLRTRRAASTINEQRPKSNDQ
jgi:hypothetical protein